MAGLKRTQAEYRRYRAEINRENLRRRLLKKLADGWHLEHTKPNGGGVCWDYKKGSMVVPAWLFNEMFNKGYRLDHTTGFYEPPKAEQ